MTYCISEYKSDLEDKLQTYNKINGAIWRHFGKQMTKETKLTHFGQMTQICVICVTTVKNG
jgi:hypothetical protein